MRLARAAEDTRASGFPAFIVAAAILSLVGAAILHSSAWPPFCESRHSGSEEQAKTVVRFGSISASTLWDLIPALLWATAHSILSGWFASLVLQVCSSWQKKGFVCHRSGCNFGGPQSHFYAPITHRNPAFWSPLFQWRTHPCHQTWKRRPAHQGPLNNIRLCWGSVLLRPIISPASLKPRLA